MGTGSFPGVKRPGRGVEHPLHLAPKLRKVQSYASTPPLSLVAYYRVNFTFTFTLFMGDERRMCLGCGLWIIQEPNKLALWNKLHFEEKKTESTEYV